MARLRVIVLDQDPSDLNTYRCVFWADVPTARQPFYANTNAQSVWTGAQAGDNTALQNGSVVELVTTQRMPSGTPLVQVENFLQVQWQNFQNSITNSNPWSHYGSTWDGTTWVLNTVA